MSTSKSGVFSGMMIALVSLVTGMVLASRLDLAPRSFAAVSVPPTNSAPLAGPIDATTFRRIAHDESPTVVSIVISGHRKRPSIDDLFGLQTPPSRRRPNGRGNGNGNGNGGGAPAEQQDVPIQGAGSGFIIDKAGFILTNNHVIEDADSIAVKFDGMNDLEEGVPAKVVGHDEFTDVALLQLIEAPKTPLPEAKFGDSTQMAAGDWVMAIGNPFELSNTVTVGVVSSVGRPITKSQGVGGIRAQNMIQTDAAINRGNSGGPLLNIRGEVIGINTMIFTDDSSGGNVGIGFAIPINSIRDMLPGLKAGKVARGVLGVSVERLTIPKDVADRFGLPSQQGALVSRVTPGGPAQAAGLKIKDVIVNFNGQVVHDDNELVSLVMATVPGTTVPVKLYRGGKLTTMNAKIGELNLTAENAAPALAASTDEPPAMPTGRKTSIGLYLADLTPAISKAVSLPADKKGALITNIAPQSDAQPALAQFRIFSAGEVVMEIDDKAVANATEAAAAFDALPAGHTAVVVMWRQGEPQLSLVKKH
jgi:serine protease Do